MVARVSIYDVPAERLDEAEDRFREALDEISGMEGLQGHYFLVGRDSNRAMVITLWEGHDALAASNVAASRLRSEAARALDGEVLSVDEFAVAFHAEPGLEPLGQAAR
jgi:heme-degrading monooxygenase HmoA